MSIYEIPGNNNGSRAEKLEDNINEREKRRGRIISLAKELTENREKFSFSGIEADSYLKLKADENEFPGFVAPIDELIQRCEAEGIKIVLGDDPESGNVFVLPYESDDVRNDSIRPQHLKIDENMDRRIKELVLLNKK